MGRGSILGIVISPTQLEINSVVFVSPTIFAGKAGTAQNHGIEDFCLVAKRMVAGQFKQEVGKLCKADGSGFLVQVNVLCHNASL